MPSKNDILGIKKPRKSGVFFMYTFNYLARRSLLALNFATFFALIFISSPVKGLRPFLAALLLTENVPKPTNVNLSPLFKAFVTPSIKELSAAVAATFVISASSAILVISSALVIKSKVCV